MCGIAGFVGDGNKKKLDKMLNAIKSRGPDDSGTYISGEVGLGSNRLSIIDLSKNGHQPMFNEDKTMCIVYNGEVYNFLNLRKKLEEWRPGDSNIIFSEAVKSVPPVPTEWKELVV